MKIAKIKQISEKKCFAWFLFYKFKKTDGTSKGPTELRIYIFGDGQANLVGLDGVAKRHTVLETDNLWWLLQFCIFRIERPFKSSSVVFEWPNFVKRWFCFGCGSENMLQIDFFDIGLSRHFIKVKPLPIVSTESLKWKVSKSPRDPIKLEEMYLVFFKTSPAD